MKVADRLKELRAAAGLSQNGLAEKSGVPVFTIRDVEQGKRLPSWPTLRKLSKALGASLGDWSGCEDEDPPSRQRRGKR